MHRVGGELMGVQQRKCVYHSVLSYPYLFYIGLKILESIAGKSMPNFYLGILSSNFQYFCQFCCVLEKEMGQK